MDAHTAQEFSAATITALIAQEVGMIFVVVAVGVFVGLLIVTLTMSTATMEHLRDFAILKAIGATRRKVLGIVLEQAITETTIGFGIGLAASFGVDRLVEALSGISTRFPMPMVASTIVAMTVLAILGSLISVRRAVTVDPMIVFRA
jgi:putative ABC transport system permease protein